MTIQQVKLLQRWVHEGDAPNPIYMCGTEALARIVSEVSKKLGFDPSPITQMQWSGTLGAPYGLAGYVLC